MDLPTLKLLAARVRGLLAQSHHPIGHNQSLDLIAALPGLRNWPEVKAFPDRVTACQLDEVSAARLGTQLKKRFGLDIAAPSLLSSLLVVSTTPPFLTILDEFGYYADVRDDRLREMVRDVEGVPKVSYQVINGQVFVFDKLLHDVKEQVAIGADVLPDDLNETVAKLLPQALVSPMEAVEKWGIVPVQYEQRSDGPEGLTIMHRPFHARIPGVFRAEHDVRQAFSRLLVGDIEPGVGEFVYGGQPLILCEPLDPEQLPDRPTLPMSDPTESSDTYRALASIDYQPGFEPVSEAVFARIKQLERDWRIESSRCMRNANTHATQLWSRTADLARWLAPLNQQPPIVPEYALEDFADLRPLYPELGSLADGALFALFDSYQMECCHINGWTANRDNDFLLYLLGKVAGFKREDAKAVGEWVAAAVLDGSAFDAALNFGVACERYDSCLASLAGRTANAMSFLARDKSTADLQGHEITTMREHFHQARSFGREPVDVEQDLSDFSEADSPSF